VSAGLTKVTTASAVKPKAPAQPPAGADVVEASAAGRPNIVLIMTDDQSLTDLSVMSTVRDRLISRGTTFANAFSPYPLCCPARATILTGQYAQNHHVEANTQPRGGFEAFDDSNTLATWMQQAGYQTAFLGKYLNGYPPDDDPSYVPPGWDEWRAPVEGIYNYRNYTINRNGIPERHRKEYTTDLVAEEAVSIIDDLSGPQPFFLWAGFLAPHEGGPGEADDPSVRFPHTRIGTPAVANHYQDSFAEVRLPDKQSINEADVSDKPAYIQKMNHRPVAALRELNQQRLESLRSVDHAVARIIDALRANGQLSNTVIMFTSDNGFLVGEHRRVGKVIGYEESIRIPLVIAGPGFDTAAKRRQDVSLVDLAPTIAEIGGAAPGLTQDGVALAPIAAGHTVAGARTMLLQAGPVRAGSDQRWYTAIRTDRWVYLRYFTGEHELYDLLRDPLQLANLAGTRDHRGVERRLAAALTTLQDCAGSQCLLPLDQLAG
jgi:arylsulfatase A-like enzyme